MSKNKKLKFEKLFKTTNFCLWLNASHPALPRGWQLRSFGTLSTCIICFFVLCNSILTYRIPNAAYGDVVRESVMILLAVTLIYKYFIIVRNRHAILNIMKYIDDNLESEKFSEVENKCVTKYTNKGLLTTKYWLFVEVLSGSLFVFKALFATVYHYCRGEIRYVQMFELVFPSFVENRKNELIGYFAVSCLVVAFDICAIITYIGFEPLLFIILLHFCGQLEILSERMRNIFTNAKNQEEVFNKLVEINVALKIIYKLVDDVQITFLAFFEFIMKTTTFLLPFLCFQIVQDLRRNVLNAEFLFMLFPAVLQFYMPCYYSNFLMEKSENMRQAIYSCGWEKHPNPRIQKIVIFMLTRTTKPVVLSTVFYPLNLETFSEMCRQAYAIYSIIGALWS